MPPRADVLLVERGLFESRARAQAAIEAGLVRADGRIVGKPSQPLSADALLDAHAPHPWASRGGLKLEAALDGFHIDPFGKVCLDVGASTGGFTDVLLTRGAGRVFAVDVGRDQLHPRLRGDPRIVSLEGVDARHLTATKLTPAPALIVCDVSFISLRLALPIPLSLAAPRAMLIALIKPQFEAGRGHVGRGVVRDPALHARVCGEISAFLAGLGWRPRGVTPSPIEGGDGNREFFIAADAPC